jgi:hypothetical protein
LFVRLPASASSTYCRLGHTSNVDQPSAVSSPPEERYKNDPANQRMRAFSTVARLQQLLSASEAGRPVDLWRSTPISRPCRPRQMRHAGRLCEGHSIVRQNLVLRSIETGYFHLHVVTDGVPAIDAVCEGGRLGDAVFVTFPLLRWLILSKKNTVKIAPHYACCFG